MLKIQKLHINHAESQARNKMFDKETKCFTKLQQ